MTYQDTLHFLYEQLPMYQRLGQAAFKKDLTNIRALLAVLNHPERRFASIHVGGTNGKGSVSHLLSAALQAAGYRVGLYTSPHYRDFRERIKIDGQLVDEQFVVDFVAQLRPALADIQPSFFEITVAMAFQAFAQRSVDIAVVEVGLGGRLDSTNVLLPELSVITNISLDHQQMLGDSLPEIASEKAGIIKPATPVVIGETQVATTPVFRAKAAQVNAPLYFADQLFWVRELEHDFDYTYYEVQRLQRLYQPRLAAQLHGSYQRFNLQTALAALEIWQQHHPQRSVTPEAVENGWQKLRSLTHYQGRWQWLSHEPAVLVDSAHNVGGLTEVLAALRAYERPLHIVLGVVNDKKLEDVLPLFPSTARYYFAKANIPRGLSATNLQAAAAHYGLRGETYPNVVAALDTAKAAAKSQDLIFVGGSIFTVAEVL
ncbi:MAG: folylpolyglutamate synthase/dihydrofolate synthase family protein [Bacteroidota bacterium]